MKIKNVYLEYNVLRYDFNNKKIVKYNVLWKSLPEELAKLIRSKKITNRDELYTYLKREFRYYYWCRAEHEVLIGGIHLKDIGELEKIDIFSQIELNLDLIVNYIMYKMDIKF